MADRPTLHQWPTAWALSRRTARPSPPYTTRPRDPDPFRRPTGHGIRPCEKPTTITKAAGGVVTAKQAPRRPGSAPAPGLRAELVRSPEYRRPHSPARVSKPSTTLGSRSLTTGLRPQPTPSVFGRTAIESDRRTPECNSAILPRRLSNSRFEVCLLRGADCNGFETCDRRVNARGRGREVSASSRFGAVFRATPQFLRSHTTIKLPSVSFGVRV
jgi:hypothetical protein